MSYDVGMLPRGALKMFKGRQKWRETTGNDAGNGIFMIKARFLAHVQGLSRQMQHKESTYEKAEMISNIH